jgi:hypothetical protein
VDSTGTVSLQDKYESVLGSARHWESRCNVIESQLKTSQSEAEANKQRADNMMVELSTRQREVAGMASEIAVLQGELMRLNNENAAVANERSRKEAILKTAPQILIDFVPRGDGHGMFEKVVISNAHGETAASVELRSIITSNWHDVSTIPDSVSFIKSGDSRECNLAVKQAVTKGIKPLVAVLAEGDDATEDMRRCFTPTLLVIDSVESSGLKEIWTVLSGLSRWVLCCATNLGSTR